MIFKEDMTIDKKYLNIVGISIYDTVRELHGILSEISLLHLSGRFYIQYRPFYDRVNNKELIFPSDFEKGIIKFVLLNDKVWTKGYLKEAQDEQIEAIKEFLGENYKEDCIIWMSEQEWKDQLSAQEYREKKKIGDCAKWAESPTKELIFESYSAEKMLCLYMNKVITEEQFLMELVNILAEEKRVQRDMQLNEGVKNFRADIEKVLEDNKEFFMEALKNS